MTDNDKTILEDWSYMLSEIADSYSDTSDEELLEEAKLYGVDLDSVERDVDKAFENALNEFQSSLLQKANEEFNEVPLEEPESSFLEKSPAEKWSIFAQVTKLFPELTLQFRNLQDTSETDLDIRLRNLQKLKVIDQHGNIIKSNEE